MKDEKRTARQSDSGGRGSMSPAAAGSQPVMQTNFPTLRLARRGKVRDVYDLGEHFLIVATDRLSAYDVVMSQPIPNKGKVLTQISNFWFEKMRDILPNHIVETDVSRFPPESRLYTEVLRGRSILVKKAQPLAIECVVRGYLSGSGWEEYKRAKSVCGIPLPGGLVESSKLPEPIFTPATKAEVGHDENIDFTRAAQIVGDENARKTRDFTIAIYNRAVKIAEERGIIIADTKMEFGLDPPDGHTRSLILIDELLTPDSSRFWPRDTYRPGRAQESYDKQYVRDYLLSINFNKQPPAPELPPEVIRKTSDLYSKALRQLTGEDLQ